jgi:hypothetical protein
MAFYFFFSFLSLHFFFFSFSVVFASMSDLDPNSLISRRCAMQIMMHHSAYAALRKDAIDAMQAGRLFVYSVVSVGEKDEDNEYVAVRMPDFAADPLIECLMKAESGPLSLATQGIVVQEREDGEYFIPYLGTMSDEDGLENRFFWFDGTTHPLPKMIALDGSQNPVPSSCDHGRTVIGVLGHLPLISLFMESVAVAVKMKHHCWSCQRPVSGRNKCSKCRRAIYCGSECQRVDWSRHKKEDCT